MPFILISIHNLHMRWKFQLRIFLRLGQFRSSKCLSVKSDGLIPKQYNVLFFDVSTMYNRCTLNKVHSSLKNVSNTSIKTERNEPCLLFSKHTDIWIILYVDDLSVATKTLKAQQFVKKFLFTQFKM